MKNRVPSPEQAMASALEEVLERDGPTGIDAAIDGHRAELGGMAKRIVNRQKQPKNPTSDSASQ